MADPDAVLKETIASFLKEQKLSVTEIPRAIGKTPDLLVDSGTSGATLLEIKSKADDPDEMHELANRLAEGRVVEHSKPTTRWNRLDAILRQGVAQMTTHDPGREFHHIIWFHCTGLDATAAELRLFATLYGTRNLVSTRIKNVIIAYYFSYNAFFRHRESLDGVIISKGAKAGLYLNSFSSRLAVVQGSPIARPFGDAFFPEKYTDSPNVMICDPAAPRGDEPAMLEFLRNKYAVDHLQIMDMGLIAGMIGTPEDSE